MSSSPKSKAKQLREPPPSLFLGPPSQNASHVSLPGVTTVQPSKPSRAPLFRQRSHLAARGNLDGSPDTTLGSSLPRNAPPRQQQDAEVKKQADRTDALWAEMQTTLEEVELNAVSGTHVFGAEHGKALESLRAAQIELAQAWARSEADEAIESTDKGSKTVGGKGLAFGSEARSALDTAGSTVPSASGRPGSSGIAMGTAHSMGSSMEEETEADILLARKRREANDRYFQRVNEGVLDVVAKLEHVANAMKAVEQESRDIWGENESTRTSLHEP
ncbi:uncharacterized protein L3040_001358 [Drepanopeziza brunnea f. sp. 'multigermtubi']|nr:hypothetical protein L3040_001358 [Drepanopeziza brunnea f. sp. 'multigermtubi']